MHFDAEGPLPPGMLNSLRCLLHGIQNLFQMRPHKLVPEYVSLRALQVADLAGPQLCSRLWTEALPIEAWERGGRVGPIQVLQVSRHRQAC